MPFTPEQIAEIDQFLLKLFKAIEAGRPYPETSKQAQDFLEAHSHNSRCTQPAPLLWLYHRSIEPFLPADPNNPDRDDRTLDIHHIKHDSDSVAYWGKLPFDATTIEVQGFSDEQREALFEVLKCHLVQFALDGSTTRAQETLTHNLRESCGHHLELRDLIKPNTAKVRTDFLRTFPGQPHRNEQVRRLFQMANDPANASRSGMDIAREIIGDRDDREKKARVLYDKARKWIEDHPPVNAV